MEPIIRTDMMETPLERCKKAIEAGDKETALAAAQTIWDESRPLHDLYVQMSGLFCTYIRDHCGEAAVEEVWRGIGEQLWKPVLLGLRDNANTAVFADVYAMFLRAHGHTFTVIEDDEKYTFRMDFCASGGMLMRDGHNEDSDRSPVNIAVTKTKADWTFNEPISTYCVHSPLWMDIQPREWGWDVMKSTFGRQFDDQGNPIDDPCVAMIYKEPQS